MTYTIEETDLERQHLLAQFLNPVSVKALENISLKKDAKILDIGCGLVDTTLYLCNGWLKRNKTRLQAWRSYVGLLAKNTE